MQVHLLLPELRSQPGRKGLEVLTHARALRGRAHIAVRSGRPSCWCARCCLWLVTCGSAAAGLPLLARSLRALEHQPTTPRVAAGAVRIQADMVLVSPPFPRPFPASGVNLQPLVFFIQPKSVFLVICFEALRRILTSRIGGHSPGGGYMHYVSAQSRHDSGVCTCLDESRLCLSISYLRV